MNRRICLTTLAAMALVLASRTSSTMAGKPAPPPPPPPPPPEQIYEDRRADLGGWLDTRTNLVWGLSINSVTGGSDSYAYAVGEVAKYATILADGSVSFDQRAQDYEALSLQYASDPVKSQKYADLATAYGAAADDLAAEAVVAAQFNNWRIPSKDEVADAINKGYFTYTPTWGAWDVSPLPGLQQEMYNYLYWTSTADKKPGLQWAFEPLDGTLHAISKDRSYIYVVAVRTYTP